MSSSLKSGSLIVFILTAMLFIFLSCVSTPPNPYDFSNTKINLTLKSSSNQTAIDTMADTVGKTVQVGITSNFPSYVDSIEITVFNSANGHVDIDTILKQLLPLKNGDTLWYQTAFATSGKRTIMGTVYAEGNNKYSTKGFIINIFDEPAKPVLRAWPHLVINKTINITPSQTCSLAVSAQDSNTAQAHTFYMKQDTQPQVEFTPPFIWAPPSGFIGTSLVFFKVTDTDSPLYFDTATVTITVSATPINHPPKWTDKTINEVGSPGNAINVTLSSMCADPDGDTLTFSLLQGAPSNDSIANTATNPTYTFLPGPGDTGTFYPKIVVTDSKGGYDTLTITLNIHAQSVSSKALTAFSFTSPAVTGTINESAKTVALTVPFGTDVTALIATFTTTGASVKVGSAIQTSVATANNYTSPLTYTVIGIDGSTQAYVVTVTVASNAAKALTAFSFTSPAVTGTINESAKTVALTVPYGTDVTTLVATFAVSLGASVKVGSTAQTSGTTANNFTSPVTYTVVAADGSTQAYVVTVTIVSNTAKALTAFSFTSPAVMGTINESAKTVALTVPFGTDVTALVATFASTGASVKVGTTTQTSGTTANNFTSPVTYTVVAADGSTQAYVVTVTIAANTSKALTAFSFTSPVATGIINESAKTVALTAPFGMDVTALVATFASTGASVKVGSTVQTSGTTPNNFTSPVTYTVVAADGSTQGYVVTVSVGQNTAKALTSFSFASPAATGTVTESSKTVAITVPFGTDVSALVATFVSTGSSVKVGTVVQTSGTTPNNFTSPVTYTVVAADGSTQAYVVTVSVGQNAAKALTSFSFASPAATGTVTEASKTVAITVPFGTDVTALKASFVSTGASVKVGTVMQTSGTTPNNFTSPVTYTVVAADGSTQAYVVTVTVGANPAKALTSFSFASPAASGTITESSKTVALTVPFGTDVTALKASFVSTGASVKVGTVMQTSGTTPNNFTSPVTYTVVAADGSTQAYVVTVTIGANSAIIITTQPQDQTKCIGSPVSFSVSANTAVGTLSYQWKNASGNLTEGHFVGTTSNSLSISAVAAGDAATYSCYITSTGGGSPVTSSGAKLTVNMASTAPSAAGASPSSVCSGGTSTLTEIGGTLGTGAVWKWYTDTTAAALSTTGASISVSLTASTTYYIRAEGTCGNSAFKSVTVTINTKPTPPTGTTAYSTCSGTPVTLTATAPSGTTLGWYTDAACTTPLSSTSVSPTQTTSYYVRAERGTGKESCNVSDPLTVTVTINTKPSAPTGTTAYSTCSGTPVALSATAPSGTTLGWYTNSTCTTPLSSTSVSPTQTTSYYVRAERGTGKESCNVSDPLIVTVTVNTTPAAPTGVSANPATVISGQSSSLSAAAPPAGWTLKWYTNSGCTTPVSPNNTGSPITVSPASTTIYYVRAEGPCSPSSPANVTVTFAQTYSVTYNGNGNQIGSPPNDNNHYQAGATISVLSGSNNMSRNGYVFVGWKGGPADTNTKTFTMPANNVTLNAQWDVRDTDGNHYDTIVINTSFGTQTWMVQNLKTTRYNNGASIPHVNGSTDWSKLSSSASAYCWYNDDITNKINYGALYNFNAVNTGKLAPKGWHVATDGDFEALNDFLLNTPAYISNFAPYFGGSVSGGLFGELDQIGNWWSSTYVDLGSGSVMFYIQSYSGRSGMNDDILTDGLSVRCIRGDPSQ